VVHGKDACRGNALGAPSAALVEGLQRAGFAVLAIDLRGHGSSGTARLTYGALECQDVLGAVDWLQTLGHRRIGVLGASMGAVATLNAAALETAIETVVVGAFADLGKVLQRNNRRLTHLPGAMFPASALAPRWLTGVDLRRFRPLDLAGALVSRPVLLIHSEGDRLVPCEHARRLARAIGARLWITPSIGCHLSSYRSDPDAYELRVHDFFAGALAPASPVAAA
jgi:dipeptidyl aminopeptidase/acylaminoacyl peptidase